MKRRSKLVSNSSSTSFTCEACGDMRYGFDSSLEEMGGFECEKGHTICASCVEGSKEEARAESDEYNENMPSRFCPCCTLEEVSRDDIEWYAKKKLGMTAKELEAEIKSKFKSAAEMYDAFPPNKRD